MRISDWSSDVCSSDLSVLIDLLAGAAASATASRVLGDHNVMVDGVEIAVGHDDHHLHHLLAEVDLVVLHRLTLEGPEIAEVRRNQVPAPEIGSAAGRERVCPSV